MPHAPTGGEKPPTAPGDGTPARISGQRRDRAVRVLRRWFPSHRSTPKPGWWQLSRGYLSAVAILAVLAGLITGAGGPHPPTPGPPADARCTHPPGSDIWFQGGECVGITDGHYSFGYPAVMGKILALNQQKPCAAGDRHVTTATVGVMVTLHSVNTGVRAEHELEGITARLREARQDSSALGVCWHPIHLLVAQLGRNEQAAAREASILKRQGAAAVVGMGLSNQQSADAAAVLSKEPEAVPMVADLITATGFTQGTLPAGFTSAADSDDGCAAPSASADWERGFPGFYRVAVDAQTQISELLGYLDHGPHPRTPLIVRPNTTPDPYSCTALPLITAGLDNGGMEGWEWVYFTPGEADATALSAARRICQSSSPVYAFYVARGIYLSVLLSDIASLHHEAECQAPAVTVLSESDAAQLRVQAPRNYDAARRSFLKSRFFTSGKLRVLYPPLADPDQIRPGMPGIGDIRSAFAVEKFPLADLDDGWAMMGYDSLSTVATALQRIDGRPSPSQIQDAINNHTDPVPGADSPVLFDRNGNRAGPGPGLVRLCASGGPWGDPVSTVAVRGGRVPACPR